MKTSDSERNLGFESLTLRQKNDTILTGWYRFFDGGQGFERPLRKHAGGMFLGRGRIHAHTDAPSMGVNGCASWEHKYLKCTFSVLADYPGLFPFGTLNPKITMPFLNFRRIYGAAAAQTCHRR